MYDGGGIGITVSAEFSIDLLTALWLGFTGGCIGSFLNVVAYRMPRGISVVWKPSHCPKCGHPIRARDNVPVLGWLLLRGKCRDCGGPISPRYAIVEAVMGAVFFVLAYAELFSGGANLPGGPLTTSTGALGNLWNPQWPIICIYVYHCVLLSLLTSVLLISQDKQSVPWSLVVFAVVVGLAVPYGWTAPTTGRHWWMDLLGKLTGCLAGFLCGIIGERLTASEREKLLPSHWGGAQWMLVLTGLYLGWQAVGIVFLAALVLALITRLVFSNSELTSELSKTTSVFCATILLLVFGHF